MAVENRERFEADQEDQADRPDRAGDRSALAKHWYVVIDDIDIGPMDIGELEAHWQAHTVDQSSLAWRSPMAGWLPIGDIPELRYLAARPMPAPAPTIWQSSEGMSLSSLVAHELADPKPAVPQRPTAPVIEGLPDLNRLGYAQGRRQTWQDWGAAVRRTPGELRVSSPHLRLQIEQQPKRLMVGMLIGGCFALLTLGLVLAVAELLRDPSAAANTSEPEATAMSPMSLVRVGQAPLPPTAPVAPTVPTVPTTPTVPTVPTTPTTPTSVPEAATETAAVAQPEELPAQAAQPSPQSQPRKRKTRKTSGMPTLSKQDVYAGIKTNAKNLSPCLTAARNNGDLAAGRIKLLLSWTIKKDGSVTKAKLLGPPVVLRGNVSACFASKMRRWTFKASGRATKVSNFKLPVTLR